MERASFLGVAHYSRRLSRIPEQVWNGLLRRLAVSFHEAGSYVMDNFLSLYICMKRCNIYRDEQFLGYVSSSDDYFYGLKVHELMTESGISANIFSQVPYANVNDLYDFFHIHLNPVRKRNSKKI